MLTYIFVSLLVGCLLNEEAALDRISKNLSYPHLGWCLLNYEPAFWVAGFFFILAFFKSWLFSVLLKEGLTVYWPLGASVYLLGNALSAARCRGFYFTPWVALMGMILARHSLVFQASLTVFCTVLVIARKLSLAVDAWLLALSFFILTLLPFPESACWLSALTFACIISGRHSPILAALIK